MADIVVSPLQVHPIIQDAYIAAHDWLRSLSITNGYTKLQYDEVKSSLSSKTMVSAAAQFHTYFPSHYYKTIHTLKNVLSLSTLCAWLKYNPHLCIIDVGCGAGAASAGLIETIMTLQESGMVENAVSLTCLGIDPNPNAIGIYKKFLDEVTTRVDHSRLQFSVDVKPDGIPNVTSWIIHRLNQIRAQYALPHLPHVIVMQVNVVSPLNKDYENRQENYEILKSLGIQVDEISHNPDQFGYEEALAYKAIFESGFIDNLHVVTISTVGYLLEERVKELGETVGSVFSTNRHKATLLHQGLQTAEFYNFLGSRYESQRSPYSRQFYTTILSATNEDFRADRNWHEVIDVDNLRLAWIRVRQGLLGESLVDEVEIRLFEDDLENNLIRVRQQLIAYADNVARTDDYVMLHIRFPKARLRHAHAACPPWNVKYYL